MKSPDIDNLIIRGAVVRDKNVGFILACDPEEIDNDEQHTYLFTYHKGKFSSGRVNFNAQDCCIVNSPEFAVVSISAQGHYSAEARSGFTADNVFKRTKSEKQKFGDFRSVTTISGTSYIVGYQGMVFKMKSFLEWELVGGGLNEEIDLEDIDGYGHADLYVVGFNGGLYVFDGKKWNQLELPTNVTLGCVKCALDDRVFIGGDKGVLMVGYGNRWQIFDQDIITDDIWDIEEFNGIIYVSTLSGVYTIKENELHKIDTGELSSATTYKLTVCDEVLWSVGAKDIFSFDGSAWSRIV